MQQTIIETPLGSLDATVSGEGPDVVFLHGLMTGGAIWQEVIEQLSSTARCIAVEMPFGAHLRPMNDDADLSVPSLAEALAEPLAQLCPNGYLLVASDTGGVVAQQLLCSNAPGLRATLLLPCDLYENFLPRPLRYLQYVARIPAGMWAVRWALEVPAVRSLPIAFGWLTRQGLTPQLVRDTIDPLRRGAIRRDLAKLLVAIDPAITRRTAAALPQVRTPVRFLWATDDRLFPAADARRLADSMGDTATWDEAPGSYSFIQVDRPGAVVRAVETLVGCNPEGQRTN